jgi:hypothetical protein
MKNLKMPIVGNPMKYLSFLSLCTNIRKEVAIAFWDLIENKVNDDIEKSPFQYKFLTTFFKEYFNFTFASVWYQPWRWELNLDALIELYRLIEHMEKFNYPTPTTPPKNIPKRIASV